LFGKFVEHNILFPRFDDRHARQIQKIFTGKEQTLLRYMDKVNQCVQETNRTPCYIDFHNKNAGFLKKQGLYLFVYSNDTLNYWSTKDVPVPETYSSSDFDKSYVSIGNSLHASGKYVSYVKKENDYKIVGLVLIKNVYTYENKYLKTAFQKQFRLPDNVKISPELEDGSYPIFNSAGQFVWSLIFDNTCFYWFRIYLQAVAYLLAIIILLWLMDSILCVLRTTSSKKLCLSALALVLIAIRLIMLKWKFPEIFYQLNVFKPVYFASEWFSSLGELGLWCIFIGFFILELFRFLNFKNEYERKWKYFLSLSALFFTVIVCFFAICGLIKILVINSNDIFEGPNRILLLNGYSLLGIAIIMIFLASFCLLLSNLIQLCKQELTYYQFIIFYTIILSMTMIGWGMANLSISLTGIFFLSVVILTAGFMQLKRKIKYSYSHYILLIFILALFTSVSINRYSYEKYKDQKMILVTNLATQHDLTAEFLLRNISERINSDTDALAEVAYRDFPYTSENVLQYIKKQYFYSSHWNQYIFRCCVCNSSSSLVIDQQLKGNCIRYYKNLTENMGTQLPRSEFWYIDHRPYDWSTYLGWFYVKKEGHEPLQVFIELGPNGASDEVGYPELLLDERLVKSNNLKGYSYAKYRNNRRVSQYGDYSYNLNGDIFQIGNSDYYTVKADGMEHVVYRPDENNIMVLSSYLPKTGDLVINFSYIFIFFFIIVSIGWLIFNTPDILKNFQWNFRNKIQYSMIAVILVSFAVIAIFTVSYINRQYRNKNNDIVNEKMRAIHKELSTALLFQNEKEEKDEADIEMFTLLLSDYKLLFFTDINLFNVHGQLIATSLSDIFVMGIIGRQINPDAYIKLAFYQRASIIENEEIGGLHYISAYEPFIDRENNVIAFLNLAYFTQQDTLAEEISNVVMALLNFYMIIILITVIVSVMMSNQITLPLMMLQEKFRSIKLGAKNESVFYNKNDELGSLVKEYNRAIDELARSAARLARSERESAWREMAKQIAHEINNPLTPMKLSVQHLKRAYDNKSERFDAYMENISSSLVEQIDTLSAIATEFSNFAKMPAPQNEKFDLIDKINNVVPLFAIDENRRSFHTEFHGLEHAMIFADKEQISRVFINLIKNAIQAIPRNRQAKIQIDVLKINRIIWVRIKDNGMGIPDEMLNKLFRPNFTTKSSGMGIGLSIVHSIIESAGGTINFKTRQGEGTTFIIGFPAAE